MILYLDDDSAAHRLAGLLNRQGHQVTLPNQVSMSGKSDPEHFLFAIQRGLTLLTRNWRDFERLHELVVGSGGKHPGVLTIRAEKDRSKDMRPPAIAKAIAKLEKFGVEVKNEATVLNHWR